MFGLALVFDLAFGSKRLLGWLPCPDDFFERLATFFRTRLDRANRSSGERFVRGIIVLVVTIPVLFFAGLWFTVKVTDDSLSVILSAIVLSLMIRQRQLWSDVIAASMDATDSRTKEQIRLSGRAMVTAFCDRVVVALTLFAFGGFALLLPYRFLRVIIAMDTEGNSEAPAQPFLRPFWPLAELMALPGSWIAAFLMASAHIFIPGTNLSAFKGLFMMRRRAMPSQYWPLAVTAQGLELSFRFSKTKGARWIGPEGGRAKQTNADIRRIGLLLVVATLLGLVLASMLLTALYR